MDEARMGRGNVEEEERLLEAVVGDTEIPEVKRCSPQTTTKITNRIRALCMRLLEIEVDTDELRSPTSSVINHDVIDAFAKCGGDFADAVPYCLMEARRWFKRQSRIEPADFGEHLSRATACEVLARRIMTKIPVERQYQVMSARYTRLESDGDESLPTSALESAVDQLATFFLSSTETQRCVAALWNGHLVLRIDEHGHVSYHPYANAGKPGFLNHLDPSRLAVPRLQNWFKILLWAIFLVAYTWALQTPDRAFGIEDWDIQVLGYLLEDLTKIYKVFSLSAITFWVCINFAIYSLLLVAFAYRMADTITHDPDQEVKYRFISFQILACAAPFVWVKLLTIFDQFSFFGTLQIVVARMLRESAVFFALLLLLALGFMQALTGLDIADKQRDSTVSVARSLFEGLLGSPGFELYDNDGSGVAYPADGWSFAVLVILLNVLVALFGSAYSEVTDSAIDMCPCKLLTTELTRADLAFWSSKVVAAIRAPDENVYVAPFNLIELVILPLEFCLSREAYLRLNRVIMSIVFAPALVVFALYESYFDAQAVRKTRQRLAEEDEDEVDENPSADESGEISKLSFDDLVKAFPDLTASATSAILREVKQLRKEIETLKAGSPPPSVKQEDGGK